MSAPQAPKSIIDRLLDRPPQVREHGGLERVFWLRSGLDEQRVEMLVPLVDARDRGVSHLASCSLQARIHASSALALARSAAINASTSSWTSTPSSAEYRAAPSASMRTRRPSCTSSCQRSGIEEILLMLLVQRQRHAPARVLLGIGRVATSHARRHLRPVTMRRALRSRGASVENH